MNTRTDALTAIATLQANGADQAMLDIIAGFLATLPVEKVTCTTCNGKGCHRVPAGRLVHCLTCDGEGTVVATAA